MHLLALDATFIRFELRCDCLLSLHKDLLALLALHRDLQALHVHAVPPMRDDNMSNRGLGPEVPCDTTKLGRVDGALINCSIRVLNPRPNIDSAQPLSIFTRVPAKHVAKLDDPVPLALAISSFPVHRVHRSTRFSPRPGPADEHGLRNATAASALLELAANAISTNPTPGNTIVPPTTWCEKKASAAVDSAPENTTASSSRDC